MNSRKKIPLRKCVVTGEMKPKKELIRVVRSKEGEVSVDATGKRTDAELTFLSIKKPFLRQRTNAVYSSNFRHRLTNTYLKNY